MNNTNSRVLQIANIIGLLSVITFNALANILSFGGRNTGEVSQMYDNLFVPAAYAFSIWGLIYVLLLIFVVLQAKGLFARAEEAPEYVQRIGWWFFISCLANVGWLFAWHYLLLPLSVMLMLLLLGCLLTIYLRLGIGQATTLVPWPVRLAFSVYLGWITIATVANITALMVAFEWNGFGLSEVIWTITMLIIATLITLAVLWTRKDWAYAAVVVWAFTAILVRRQTEDYPGDDAIVTTVIVLLVVLVLGAVGRFLTGRNG